MKFGDLYYEEMSIDETLYKGFKIERNPDRMLKTQSDIEMYVEDNINHKIPLDGPQWRCYLQNYENPADG